VTAIRERFQVVAAAALLFACASKTPMLPVCPELEAMQPLPDEQCLADPETREFEEALVTLLEDDTSPLLVRVEFDPQAAIGAICADETSEQRQALSRRRLGEQLPMISTLAPGPVCLAESRLDFNRMGQQIAVARRLLRNCARQARRVGAAAERDPTAHGAGAQASRTYLECSNRHQRRLEQIWIFPEQSIRGHLYLFEATPQASSREIAIRVCSRDRGSIERTGVSLGGDELDDCMRSKGWNPVK